MVSPIVQQRLHPHTYRLRDRYVAFELYGPANSSYALRCTPNRPRRPCRRSSTTRGKMAIGDVAPGDLDVTVGIMGVWGRLADLDPAEATTPRIDAPLRRPPAGLHRRPRKRVLAPVGQHRHRAAVAVLAALVAALVGLVFAVRHGCGGVRYPLWAKN